MARFSMTTQGTRDPAREVREHLRWVEDEYQVDSEWTYTPLILLNGEPRIRCMLVLTPLPWNETQDVHWGIACTWPQGAPVKAMEAHRLLLVSKLALDLQMYRTFGERECQYLLPFPPAQP